MGTCVLALVRTGLNLFVRGYLLAYLEGWMGQVQMQAQEQEQVQVQVQVHMHVQGLRYLCMCDSD